MWCFGQTTLFLFLLAKVALAYLPTALSVVLRPLSFSAGLVYSSFSHEACSILQDLCWIRQHQKVCHFFSIRLSFFPPRRLSFYLKLSGWNYLLSPPVLSGYNGSPDTRFSWGTTQLMGWPYREHYLCPLQSFVVALLLFLLSTFLFSQNGVVLSRLNFLTCRFPQFSPRNLCSLVMFIVFFFVFAAMDTALL